MKSMVSSESSNVYGEALRVRGKSKKKKSNNGPRGKSSNSYRGRSKSKSKDKFCRYCKKDNHDISECYKLKNKEKRNGTYKAKGKFDEEGKASIAANDSNSDGEILVAFAGCASSSDEWILDTAASFHIGQHGDWFTTYEPVKDAASVRMGDDTPHPIIGIESVQIK